MLKNKVRKRIFQELSYVTGKYLISPEIASLVITYRCNFRCLACTVWRMDEYPELSQTAWEAACKQLKATLSQNTTIEISGGEPLLRKGLVFFMISQLRNFFKNVGINSNGSLLDEPTVLALKKSGITYAKISLYSTNDEKHDKLRGFSGAAQQAKKAIDLLAKHGIKTDIGVLITAENISDIPELIRYLNQPTYANVSIILQPLDEPIGLPPIVGENKTNTIETLWPNKKSVQDLSFWLQKNKPRNVKNSRASLQAIEKYYLDHTSALNRRCFAGQRNLAIYPDGEVFLCYKGGAIGNISKDALSEILSGEKASKERRKIKKCQSCCRIIGCNFQKTFPELFNLS
jgi:MoaA/NifB/PqqE/SkfB family radical SAM enzyme